MDYLPSLFGLISVPSLAINLKFNLSLDDSIYGTLLEKGYI